MRIQIKKKASTLFSLTLVDLMFQVLFVLVIILGVSLYKDKNSIDKKTQDDFAGYLSSVGKTWNVLNIFMGFSKEDYPQLEAFKEARKSNPNLSLGEYFANNFTSIGLPPCDLLTLAPGGSASPLVEIWFGNGKYRILPIDQGSDINSDLSKQIKPILNRRLSSGQFAVAASKLKRLTADRCALYARIRFCPGASPESINKIEEFFYKSSSRPMDARQERLFCN